MVEYEYCSFRNEKVAQTLPLPVSRAITQLGQNIERARRRRGLSQDDLAQRMGVSVSTVRRLEAGNPGIALQHLASALLVFGELAKLQEILDTATDSVGLILADEKLPKRIHTKRNREPQAF